MLGPRATVSIYKPRILVRAAILAGLQGGRVGAVLAKIEWQKKIERPPQTAYEVAVPGTYSEVTFMLKDSKRFPKTDGWGYASFRYDAKSDTFKAFGDVPEFANTCHGCHTAFVKARDFVFTDYPKR